MIRTETKQAEKIDQKKWAIRVKEKLGDPIAYAMLAPALILIAIFFYYPIIQSFYMSLFNWPLLGERVFIGLGNYVEMFSDEVVMQSWRFTITWTLVITPLIFFSGLILAFLTYSPRKGMGLFRSVYFMPTVLMTVAAGVVWRWFFGSQVYGLANYFVLKLGIAAQPIDWLGDVPQSILAVAFSGVWMWVGLTMLLLVGAMQGIPTEILESGSLDGANWFQSAWYITLPLMRTTFGLALIISVIGSFLSFAEFLIMTEGGPSHATTPIMMWIYNVSFKYYRLGYGAALSFVLMLVLVVLTIIQLKWFHHPEEY